jgi:hypothetical protein
MTTSKFAMPSPTTPKKVLTNVCDLKVRFPTYERDRDRHLISIIKECLDWRIAHSKKDDGSNFNVRDSAIHRYLPYIKTQRDMAGVKKNICNKFGTRKDLPEFHHYYQYEELSTIFKNQRNFNPLEGILYTEEQQELCFTPSTIVETHETHDTTGDFMIEFGTRHVFKAPIMSESHYFECVKVFNEMCRSYI